MQKYYLLVQLGNSSIRNKKGLPMDKPFDFRIINF